MRRAFLLLLAASTAAAQEGARDEKPDLELPEVVIRGIDESRLGVGETPATRDPEAAPLPLMEPPAGAPAHVRLVDHAARTEFGTIRPPELPPPLTVRGHARGGSFSTIDAGFDARHQLHRGGIFGHLGGVASDGHLPGGSFSRTDAAFGVVLEPDPRAGVRLELSRRSREHDLPRRGFLTPALSGPFDTQTYRQWAGDARYRHEARGGFRAAVVLEGRDARFRAADDAPAQKLRDGSAEISLDMPLTGRFVSVGLVLGVGGRIEEAPDGSELERERFHGELTGRLAPRSGWGFEGGVAFRRFGTREVIGPKIRVAYQAPPAYRLWAALAPLLEEPPIFEHLDGTPYAAGAVGQAPESATIAMEGGIEVQPIAGLRATGRSRFRKSRGFAHPDRAEAGRYALVARGERFVFEIEGSASWRSPFGIEVWGGHRFLDLEGARQPYVPKHRSELGVTYRGAVELYTRGHVLGARDAGTGEGAPLAAAVTVDAGGAVELTRRWWLSLDVKNLLDRRYREYAEYVAPGRSVEAGFRYTF